VAQPARASDAQVAPRFAERPTEPIVRDGLVLATGIGVVAIGLGLWVGPALGGPLFALALFTLAFFRNPSRRLPADERTVVAPADGRVLDAGEIDGPDGRRVKRVGIFLSVFDVHVNRAPLAGRVTAVERGGEKFLAAFDRRAETENARCAVWLETARGERVGVVQIVGWIARRIVCHPRVGEWVERGARYGLIRFGSRTDVVLPGEAELCVRRGDRVRGGETVVARLPGGA
jgi:phosphatidylserine decarboxylase